MKKITILGSTGSIGTQTLDVIASNIELFKVEHLVAGNNADLLIQQALKFKPKSVTINNLHIDKVKSNLDGTGIDVFDETKIDMIASDNVDLVVGAITGSSGLSPVYNAIKSGNDIALANKESLVCAGDMIMKLANKHKVKIIPIDSEHSAIFQVYSKQQKSGLEKIILTASGGAFVDKDINFIKTAKLQDALKHPNWSMGQKVTIDSAGLMNKGLEVIEACYLFDVKVKDVDVVIHRQSIIHSMVSMKDGSTLAQLGYPDMKTPIAYALSYPKRIYSGVNTLNFYEMNNLTFEKPDLKKFPALQLCKNSMEDGNGKPTVLNASNELAVEQFIKGNILFGNISEIVESMLSIINSKIPNDLQEFNELHNETIAKTKEYVKSINMGNS